MQRKLLITILVCCSIFAFAQQQKSSKQPKAQHTAVKKDTVKVNYKPVGAPMPPLRLITSKGKSIADKDLKNDATLFVMMFNPFCGHCEEVTEQLKQHIGLFKNTKLVLIAASSMLPNLEYFENNLKTSECPAMIIGADTSGFIDNTFLYNSLPQINIYNKDRKLEKVFTGDVAMDSLAKYIE